MRFDYAKPGVFAWASALLCGALFVVLLMERLADPHGAQGGTGYGMLVLLGAATAASFWRLVRGTRDARATADADRVPAGVPIRPSRRGALLVGAALLAIGAGPLVWLPELTPFVRAGAWACAALGAGVLGAAAAGLLPRGYFEFRDDALVLGMASYAVVVPWDRIRALEGSHYGGNPAIYFWFDAPEAFEVVPPQRRDRFLRQVALVRGLTFIQADFYVLTTAFAIGMPDLAAAMARRCTRLVPPETLTG